MSESTIPTQDFTVPEHKGKRELLGSSSTAALEKTHGPAQFKLNKQNSDKLNNAAQVSKVDVLKSYVQAQTERASVALQDTIPSIGTLLKDAAVPAVAGGGIIG